MINYTERLTLLMQDVAARVPALSFINMADVLVFARLGRVRGHIQADILHLAVQVRMRGELRCGLGG